jgi:Response regulator
MPSNPVVHVVDDEPAVRQSLAFLVSASGYAVRVHDSATSFLQSCPYPQGHCLVTDLRMPDMDGVTLLRRMRQLNATMPSIVVTGHGDVPMAVAAMKEGALDFIEKPFEEAVLLEALERAVGAAASAEENSRDQHAVTDRLSSLSDRERQVFAGIIAGKANKTIALEQNLSPRTVEVYRANVMSKMQARTLPELVRMAIAAGIAIDAEPPA